MFSNMGDKIEKKRLAILKILNESDKPMTSPKITEVLIAQGLDVSERTVRLYLMGLDNEGLTKNYGKRGRIIIDKGQKELSAARVYEKVGFLAAKIGQMTYKMDFNLSKKSGTLIMNVSLIERDQIYRSIPLIKEVFAAGFAMGELVAVFKPGERLGELFVPEGFVGIGTICSVTLNGVLLSSGIPVNSNFGGLLEIYNKKPVRFVELIMYKGTTLDPLEVFIQSGMTDCIGAINAESGRIGASFREMPKESRDQVIDLSRQLEQVGLGGFLMIGWTDQHLLEIPVSEGSIGAVVIGGLNPMAILVEHGIRIQRLDALAGLIEYHKLFSYKELEKRVREIL